MKKSGVRIWEVNYNTKFELIHLNYHLKNTKDMFFGPTFGDGLQIESVDVEDAFEGMGGVGGDVGLVGEQGAFVEKVVLLDEFLQLRLNVGNLVPAEFVLVERHFGLLQIAQETQLLGTKNQESVSRSTFSPRGSTHAMDIFLNKTR